MTENAFPIVIITLLTCLLCWARTFILGIGKHRYFPGKAESARLSARLADSWAGLARHASQSSPLRVISKQDDRKSAQS